MSLEHDEPWPGGRSNHYLFDLNRDWFALSQPESRGRVRVFLDWFPQVTADLHEMGGDSTYFFAPPADPLNPYLTATQKAWWQELGQAIAGRFDARGFPYFVREVFDSFYPGYGESWPLYQGAIGMTFEQASARGLVLRRSDDSRLTYRDGIVDHFTAALTTAATAARSRERLLRDFLAYRRSAVTDALKAPVREYLLLPGADPSRATRLADVLVANGIEVRRALEPLKAGTHTLPAGTYVVAAAQPSARMVRNLLEAQTSMDEGFIKEQDRRRKLRLPDQVYDITAWSLPASFDVECVPVLATTGRTGPYLGSGTVSAAGLGLEAAGGATAALPPAKVAYLVPWGSATAAAVGEALRSGLKVRVAEGSFTLGGRDYPAGTAIFRASDNDASLPDALASLAQRHGLAVQATDSGYVEKGISLGSNQVRPLKAPRVLLAWDAPTQSLSAGWARYVLERRFGQPVTAVRVGSLRRVDLARYDVLVLPSGDYADALGEESVKRLKTWVAEGGTLVLVAEAARWAGREKVGLLATQPELRDGRPDAEPADKDKEKDAKKEPPKPFDYDKAIQPERERPEDNYGAILRVVLDRDHWLSAGTDGEVGAMVSGPRIFSPIKLDKGRNVGTYAAKDQLVLSGLVWDEAKEPLARKAFLIEQPTGRGHVIAFAEDPNFRAYAEATELLFLNAVLLGPAY